MDSSPSTPSAPSSRWIWVQPLPGCSSTFSASHPCSDALLFSLLPPQRLAGPVERDSRGRGSPTRFLWGQCSSADILECRSPQCHLLFISVRQPLAGGQPRSGLSFPEGTSHAAPFFLCQGSWRKVSCFLKYSGDFKNSSSVGNSAKGSFGGAAVSPTCAALPGFCSAWDPGVGGSAAGRVWFVAFHSDGVLLGILRTVWF